MQDKSSHTTKCVNFLKQERSKYEFDFSTQAKDNKFKPQSQNDNNQISQNKLKQQDQNNQIPHNKFKQQEQITRGLNSHQKFKPNKEDRQIQAKHTKYHQAHTKHKEAHQIHTKHKEYHKIHTKLRNTKLDFELLYDSLKESNKNLIFLLDEVGVYDECLLERIRLLSELSNLCFVLSLHKKQACFLKEHFSSRIIKEIELKPLNLKEFELYVREKFKLSLKTNLLKSLLKLSRANLRLVDKILHSFLTLHTFYTKENKDPSQKRLLQMSLFYHNLLGKR